MNVFRYLKKKKITILVTHPNSEICIWSCSHCKPTWKILEKKPRTHQQAFLDPAGLHVVAILLTLGYLTTPLEKRIGHTHIKSNIQQTQPVCF